MRTSSLLPWLLVSPLTIAAPDSVVHEHRDVAKACAELGATEHRRDLSPDAQWCLGFLQGVDNAVLIAGKNGCTFRELPTSYQQLARIVATSAEQMGGGGLGRIGIIKIIDSVTQCKDGRPLSTQ